jgi:ribonuclease HI
LKYELYCDGATKGQNPSTVTGVGIICYKQSTKTEIFRIVQYTSSGSNNYAEYMSVIIGLQAALAKGIQDIDVYMDSQLVIKQCNKEWKINVPLLQQLNNQVDSLKQQFKNISFYWIPRAKNTIADRLSKEALIGYN